MQDGGKVDSGMNQKRGRMKFFKVGEDIFCQKAGGYYVGGISEEVYLEGEIREGSLLTCR
jgi:hypothetical protein